MEPELPIEKLLRGYSQRRRQSALPAEKLHPVGREALLREVRRNYGRNEAARRSPRWWPKLAWALGCFFIVGFSLAIWLPPALKRKEPAASLAEGLRSTRSAIKLRVPATPPVDSPVTIDVATGMTSEPVAANEIVKAETQPMLNESIGLASSTPPPASSKTEDLSLSARREATTSHMETARAPLDARQTVVQNYSQLAPGDIQNPAKTALANGASTPVLNAFRLEQKGSLVRVVDNDGSVYSGSLDVAIVTPVVQRTEERQRRVSLSGAQPTASAPMRGAQPRSEAPSPEPEQQYFFRVSGTNRSLNQRVVFTGNLIEHSQAGTVSNVANQARQQVPRQMLLNNSRISGKAQIGSQEIQINAVPSP